MTVAIIAGEEGVGKTTQLLSLAAASESAMWGILELKDEEKIMKLETETFRPEVLCEVYPDGHKLQGNEDPSATLDKVREWRDKIYKMNSPPSTIVFDGISDLRGYAVEEWVKQDNIKRAHRGEKSREVIGEKNIGAWSEVNLTVQRILKPLVNRALKKHINLFLTAQMKDKYRHGEVVGTVPDYKPYMSYPVQCLFIMSYTDKYILECIKEPVNPRWKIENLQKGVGLLDALRTHSLIEQALSTYMILYEEDGEAKREFVDAITEDAAKEAFMKKVPNVEILEVTK